MTRRPGFALAALSILSLASATAQAAQKLSPNDQEFLNHLYKGNAMEVQLGQLDQQKSTNPSVQAFGKRMVEDHKALQAQLQKWVDNHGFKVTGGMSADDKALMDKLSAISGADFDKQYMGSMLIDHQKDIKMVQQHMESNPKSPLQPLLVQVLPIFDNHIRVAENVAGQVGLPPQVGLNQPEHPQETS